jgi:hypothetical protein
MPYYHIVFENNRIFSCIKTKSDKLEIDDVKFDHVRDRLTYAIVKSLNVNQAKARAKKLINEFKKRKTG